MLIAFNKPFNVLSQFTAEPNSPAGALADFIAIPAVYPAGRLDRDSEGLLLLTDDGRLQARLTQPNYQKEKVYLAQVEGQVSAAACAKLAAGVVLKDGKTRPAKVREIPPPEWLWPRDPPVRYRKTIPTSWLEITLQEGRNRQVRRMTAHINHPTLRLVRVRVGDIGLGELQPGQWREC